ncbi:MAG: flavin reductase family protein, partial [Leptospira sp.]|nr:flavin reductase family protein [Leptospira sp.]
MSQEINDFKTAMSRFPSGVTVVTYKSQEIDSGITVSAFSSVSLEPPLVLVCLNNSSPAVEAISATRSFSINILEASQKDVSNTFAKADESRVAYLQTASRVRGVTGACHIPGSLVVLDCELHAMHDGGDHQIVIGRVKATSL